MSTRERARSRAALIIGTDTRLHPELAFRLAQDGVDLLVIDLLAGSSLPGTDLRSCTAAPVLERIAESGRRVVTAAVDARDRSAIELALSDGIDELGGLEIVCVSAGGVVTTGESTPPPGSTILDRAPDEWQEMVTLGLTAVWKNCAIAIPHMLKGAPDGGAIVLITPQADPRSGPDRHAVTTHGVVGLMRTLSVELAPHGVRINAATPAAEVQTNAVADIGAYLVSDRARHLTGVALPVPQVLAAT
ncbi:SDR family NAD(P)-dependent oxidoreductase [Dietzia maris]